MSCSCPAAVIPRTQPDRASVAVHQEPLLEQPRARRLRPPAPGRRRRLPRRRAPALTPQIHLRHRVAHARKSNVIGITSVAMSRCFYQLMSFQNICRSQSGDGGPTRRRAIAVVMGGPARAVYLLKTVLAAFSVS